jgi:insertion element IS1 protein InsB
VGRQANPRWLGHARAPHTGQVVAEVFGRRKDKILLRLQALVEPCGSTRSDPDGWGTDERHVDTEKHLVGKGMCL